MVAIVIHRELPATKLSGGQTYVRRKYEMDLEICIFLIVHHNIEDKNMTNPNVLFTHFYQTKYRFIHLIIYQIISKLRMLFINPRKIAQFPSDMLTNIYNCRDGIVMFCAGVADSKTIKQAS